jgi:hypothetical protein
MHRHEWDATRIIPDSGAYGTVAAVLITVLGPCDHERTLKGLGWVIAAFVHRADEWRG